MSLSASPEGLTLGAGGNRRVVRDESVTFCSQVSVAGRSADREMAARIGEEVEALWTNGPAGGGGARKETREQIGIVSCLLARDKVKARAV